MRIFFRKTLLILTLATLSLSLPLSVIFAQEISVNASKLLARSELSLSPLTGSFVEGSLFDVPIYLNTKGSNVNGVQVRIGFDPNKVSIVKPLGGTSIIGVWVEPPSFDNTRGNASYVGVIPNGIRTDSGLVGTITFKAKSLSRAVISVKSDSKVLLNDGLGTETIVDLGRVEYVILPKAPEGVNVYSETHPFQDRWYNNNSPVLSWDKDPGVDGFSFVLDNMPSTVPENTVNITETTKQLEKLSDGLWHFHVKARKNGVWGGTGHYLLRIDTIPPAEFTPEVNYLLTAAVLVERTLVSFFTTDNLSGVDHYEVGVIDKSQPLTTSPVFVESESPYQVPANAGSSLTVIVRAIDKAGNVRDVSVDVKPPFVIAKFIEDYLIYILSAIILLGIVMLLIHYLFGHHIIRQLRRAFKIAKNEDEKNGTVEERVISLNMDSDIRGQTRLNYPKDNTRDPMI